MPPEILIALPDVKAVAVPPTFVIVPETGVPKAGPVIIAELIVPAFITGVLMIGDVIVLFVIVSMPSIVAKVPPVGKVTVPDAVAAALRIVAPLALPFRTRVVELKFLGAVTICEVPRIISPVPAVTQVGGSVDPLLLRI